MAFWEKASCESTSPSHFSALCQQQGPAAALCPVADLSAGLVAFSLELYVAPPDRLSNTTFYYCATRAALGEKESGSQSVRCIEGLCEEARGACLFHWAFALGFIHLDHTPVFFMVSDGLCQLVGPRRCSIWPTLTTVFLPASKEVVPSCF